ncbi:RhuM family protein [Nitrosomonas ureae]|uniref:Fic/DOC family protein n=1 Tax=Nitrosomonas ureae TaxID=44577 RepID=A0A1H9CX73_9PROT|nr:RhuM family protein [Nitrosomonas ureae]SEQ05739.1 Fic/DOC family protein [Nitrosomonas ureae]
MNTQDQITIYQSTDGSVQLEVTLDQDTVWLTQRQLSSLFDKDVRTINEHIRNVLAEQELAAEATIRKFRIVQQEGERKVSREIEHYNLDMIISVGYRVNSKKGTQFRIWASHVLKQFLVQGYALNEQKLQEQQQKLADLKQAIALSSRLFQQKDLTVSESHGILSILEQYSHALTVLDDYDHQRLQVIGIQQTGQRRISYDEAIQQIRLWREQEKLSGLFGNEKDDSFKSSLETIYQTFGGTELYPSIEEKAANLLYFIVKNHSFSDGNKRIAAACLSGFWRVMIICSIPTEEKDTMVKVIINLINGNNP